MKVSIIYKDNEKDKVNVTVTYDDLWDGDVTLARVIYPFLKKYRKMYDRRKWYMGHPMDFASDPTKPDGPDNPDRFNEWLECLDKMVYSFEWIAKKRDWDGPEQKAFFKECDRLLKLHKKELEALSILDKERFAKAKKSTSLSSLKWDRRFEILQPVHETFWPKFDAHRQKIQEGIDLFAKYFGSFWL